MKGSAEKSSIIIGRNIRAQRKIQGITASAVAEGVGVTMQQMQKYETGANRISADRLYALAELLKVEVDVFFTGLGAEEESVANDNIDYSKMYSLVKAYSSIKNEKLREQVITLAKNFSAVDTD